MVGPRTDNIDLEWANKLEGLRVKVPNRWWANYTDGRLNDGRIGTFDPSSNLWELILDDQTWGIFNMRYDAIYQYTDELASTFENYRANLLMNAVSAADEEIVVTGEAETKYVRTNPMDWKKINVSDGDTGRTIDPVPWEGDTEEFSVKITD